MIVGNDDGAARTVAPLSSDFYIDRSEAFSGSFGLGAGVSLEQAQTERLVKLAENVFGHDGKRRVRPCKVCLVADDSGAPPASIDQDPGERRQTLERFALRKLHLANTSLWLARPTDLGFEFTFRFDGGLESVEGLWWPVRALPSYRQDSLSHENLEQAREIFTTLSQVPRGCDLGSALVMLSHGLADLEHAIRFTLIWIAIEALFGPSDRQQATKRLSRRAGDFLASEAESAASIAGRVRRNYDARCAVVHGLRVQGLPQDSEGIIREAEELIRAALRKIASSEVYVAAFSGAERDKFLDDPARD